MGQYYDQDQRRYAANKEFGQSGEGWSSTTHQYTAPQREKIFVEIDVKRWRRIITIVAIGISLFLWCVFAVTIFVAYGALEVSPSPAAHTTQILLVLGLFIFSLFVCLTNTLLNKLLSKMR